jgi:hypothetical protein
LKDPVVTRLRAWGTLVTALAGLATALWKPQDQSVTRAAYQQCTAGIEKLNEGLAKEHENVATLRGYIAAKDGESLLAPSPQRPVFDAGAAMPLVPPAPPATAAVAPPAPPKKPPQGAAGKPVVTAPIPVIAMAPTMTAGPRMLDDTDGVPPPAPAPVPYHPADFDTVLKSAK